MFMNEYDIETVNEMFSEGDTPSLERATVALARLARWTDNNSDGWAYWQKPQKAAAKLTDTLYEAQMVYYRGGTVTDLTDVELTALLKPIKAFLTRQGVAHTEVFN